MKYRSRTDRAFTLIEILTVVAIIGVLVGLLFPVIKSALIKGEYTRAQNGIANLSTAFRAYYTEYGKWPVTDTTSNNTYILDQNLVLLLQGATLNPANPNALGFANPGYTPPATAVGTSRVQDNPHGTHFLDFKATDLDATGRYIDPWKQPYYVRFDVSYANAVEDPFTGGSSPKTNLSAGFLVWSAGPDNQYDNNGDSVPGQPGISPLNKDNVKSW